jgi:2-aminobenzoate-CoA ligase
MAATARYTAHIDTFARDNLPPVEDWPQFQFNLPDGRSLTYPSRVNCAVELLDRMVAAGHGERPALHAQGVTLTYRDVLERANQVAHVLVDDLGVVPGNRVLLRGANNPWMAICWLALLKAGAIAVTTMPLLRERELRYIIDKAQVTVALCDGRLDGELRAALERVETGQPVHATCFNSDDHDALEVLCAGKPTTFENVETAADDVALIAFTSGTTGQGKGCVSFHRDVLAVCDTFSRYILQPEPDDIFCGTPPLAFTYALGGLLLFPFRVGASAILIEQPSPAALLEAVTEGRATVMFTAPKMYRDLTALVADADISSLRKCVSAGEPLPASTWHGWQAATGLRIIDGIGATEMLHIFISASGDDIRPGATGKAIPGYTAQVVDIEGNPAPPGTIGRLAVRGPTGCRYLADPERQRVYVQGGWNITGDAYVMDADGYFWFQARTDDIILSSGYNISGLEVENVLLEHAAVAECAVIGLPDEVRGQLVTAFVVLRPGFSADSATVQELQDFVKAEIAPYKYPRRIEFVASLPRTETGKLQRYKLREAGGVV